MNLTEKESDKSKMRLNPYLKLKIKKNYGRNIPYLNIIRNKFSNNSINLNEL